MNISAERPFDSSLVVTLVLFILLVIVLICF